MRTVRTHCLGKNLRLLDNLRQLGSVSKGCTRFESYLCQVCEWNAEFEGHFISGNRCFKPWWAHEHMKAGRSRVEAQKMATWRRTLPIWADPSWDLGMGHTSHVGQNPWPLCSHPKKKTGFWSLTHWYYLTLVTQTVLSSFPKRWHEPLASLLGWLQASHSVVGLFFFWKPSGNHGTRTSSSSGYFHGKIIYRYEW